MGGISIVTWIWPADAVSEGDVDLVRWHPNCHYVATASSDNTVRLWDVVTGTCVRVMMGLQAPPTSLALCPDGKQVRH